MNNLEKTTTLGEILEFIQTEEGKNFMGKRPDKRQTLTFVENINKPEDILFRVGKITILPEARTIVVSGLTKTSVYTMIINPNSEQLGNEIYHQENAWTDKTDIFDIKDENGKTDLKKIREILLNDVSLPYKCFTGETRKNLQKFLGAQAATEQPEA